MKTIIALWNKEIENGRFSGKNRVIAVTEKEKKIFDKIVSRKKAENLVMRFSKKYNVIV